MSKQTEALKLALEALTHLQPTALTSFYTIGDRDKAITAIREALAEQPAQHERVQPDSECKEDDGCPTEKAVLQRFWRKAQQQEPVAWMWRCKPYCGWPEWSVSLKRPADSGRDGHKRTEGYEDVPLYTSPPASKPWVGLTDEEIETAMPSGIYDCLADPWDCGVGDGNEMRSIKKDVLRIARAVEAKLREKNA